MSSLVERLRARSDCKPFYLSNDSDDEDNIFPQKHGRTLEKFERIVRSDAKEDSCQACGESGTLLRCETCTYAYHPKCLLPPLRSPLPNNWSCPECVNPLNDIEKILHYEMRPGVADESDDPEGPKQTLVKQYLVKWKGQSYLHCTWVPEKEFLKAFNALPGLKTKVNNFHRQMNSVNSSAEDFIAIRPEWTMVDRIVASRGKDDEKEYLVKWKELPYDECCWELESDISTFQPEIERFNIFQSRSRQISSSKQKGSFKDGADIKKKQKEFQKYEHSPEFLPGGILHPYQLEGLNFLRFSWSNQTHVILADEMGLGKTIQTIAYLSSLFEEDIYPHLVIAPLSTLRNWEREFATWAPQLNVVMYVGSAKARAVIREHEFYFPKNQKKIKRRNSNRSERKEARIKFDVLLTSYEMINLDTESLKPINWACMIIDEGHHLKNKDSKLVCSLKQYDSRHRVLLTGTPLQNNLDELFMLMHFLDAGKFESLEEFQEEFEDINKEEAILRLHKMLAPHLLRREKKDVLTKLPPKVELILRVELSSKQKEYYKAILTRNYQVLTRPGGAQMSLNNVVMELRKLCCHPYMLEGVEQQVNDAKESYKQLLESSGKLQLLDKMMVRLKDQGHRVLIFSQFQGMLDLLEHYCSYKQWQYERIDGKTGGAERQVRIDRYNAKNSSKFCFLLSTRAGGLGINLATADTVIIYDSDWNPHADLQAMARVHRLGQANKVMVYRLITRGTIEERMMQMAKKKMVLEHIVVGKLNTQNINQEKLDDIIKYGSKELFADENDEAGKSRQIHYDDAAIDKLLDRDHVGDEDANLDNEGNDGILNAFKVANFEYIDDVKDAEEEAAGKNAMENKSSVNGSERKKYWEELLRDKYQEHKVEELNALGKGKRSRSKWVGGGFASLEDDYSDGEDENYEANLSGDDSNPNTTGTTSTKKPNKRKSPVADITEPLPLMEFEGKSLKVLGFNPSQRNAFLQLMMRFGVGDYDWKEFTSRMKQKSYEEIRDYGILFLTHISEDITDSPTFSDGVPKDDFNIDDVLVRIATLGFIKEKVNFASENPGTPLFSDDILFRYAGLRGAKIWKLEHDLLLLRAILKHGYGKWNDILEDKDLKIQEVVIQELNLPPINFAVPGQVGSQVQNAANSPNAEPTGNPSMENGGNDIAADGAQGSGDTKNQAPLSQRNWQRRQADFIKRRVGLMEKGLNAEYQKVYYGDADKVTNEEPKSEPKAANVPSYIFGESSSRMTNQLPQFQPIDSREILFAPRDYGTDRFQLPRFYNEMSKAVDEVSPGVLRPPFAREAGAFGNFHRQDTISEDVIRRQQYPPTAVRPIPNYNIKPVATSKKPEPEVIILDD